MTQGGPTTTTLRQKLLLVGFGLGLFVVGLALIEGALALAGIDNELLDEDPYVGFAGAEDLFARQKLPSGEVVWATRPAKLGFFNPQQFAAEKPRGGYRIFALGGSTTAGRPYDDKVAFARWLEIYLRAMDPSRPWEVINAGADSYASYRIALLVKELLRYDPDLLLVYTGHNEFLEERTYGDLRRQSPTLMQLQLWLGGLRSYALARRGWLDLRSGESAKSTLPAEVTAKLDSWTGLDLYHRDDALRRSVIEHFDYNLHRIAALARRHDIEVVFVKPISNLKDFSPFKSEHPATITRAQTERFEQLLATGRKELAEGRPRAAFDPLEQAREISPDHADLHFRLGRAHFELGDFAAARRELVPAKELDVAPLRALEAIIEKIAAVCAELDLPLIDLPAILETESRQLHGHDLLGDEVFQDHVHPTIEVHSLIAERVLDLLVERGIAHRTAEWGPERQRELYKQHLATLDRNDYAERDLRLAKVLGWAGKIEEAEAPLLRAVEALPENAEIHLNLGIVYDRTGRSEQAVAALERALAIAPGWALAHFNLGVALGHLGRVEEAVSQLREAIRQRPDYAEAFYNLGVLERRRGAPDAARAALQKARELRPGEVETERQLALVEGDRALELARQGRLEEAQNELERVVAQDPSSAEAHFNLGVVLAQRGSFEAAVGAYERALALDSKHARARNNLAIRYAAQGRLEEARRELLQAIEDDPGYAEAVFNLGVVFDQAGQPRAAIEWIEKAVTIEPDNARFHFALGSLYRALGETERARPHLELAAKGGFPAAPPNQ